MNGFKDYSLYWGKKHKENGNVNFFDRDGKGLPKNAYNQLLMNGIYPDVD